MQVINLTSQAINILTKEGCSELSQDSETKQWVAKSAVPIRVIPTSGIARVSVKTQEGDLVDGIPTQIPVYGDIEIVTKDGIISEFPSYDKEKVYIVSLMTVNALRSKGRTTDDIFTPGIVVRDRDNKSNILGCFDLNYQK